MTAALAQADQFCMCGCARSRHKGKGMCKDCGEFECDRFEVDKSRLPAPGPDAESTSAKLRRVEAERDAALAESARREETVARNVRERDHWRGVADQLQAQRDKAIGETQEIAGELADERRLSTALGQRVAELERQFADEHGSLQRARQRVGDLERQLAGVCACAMSEASMVSCPTHGYDAPDPDVQLGLELARSLAADLVHTYPALYCRTCYGRFLEDTDAATNHQHPLVPVTVTITERTTA